MLRNNFKVNENHIDNISRGEWIDFIYEMKDLFIGHYSDLVKDYKSQTKSAGDEEKFKAYLISLEKMAIFCVFLEKFLFFYKNENEKSQNERIAVNIKRTFETLTELQKLALKK